MGAAHGGEVTDLTPDVDAIAITIKRTRDSDDAAARVIARLLARGWRPPAVSGSAALTYDEAHQALKDGEVRHYLGWLYGQGFAVTRRTDIER